MYVIEFLETKVQKMDIKRPYVTPHIVTAHTNARL